MTGLLVAGDIKLSEWGRALGEKRKLIHVEKRLSRWMGSDRIDDAQLVDRYHAAIKPHLTPKHVIAVDDSDITKPRAKAMPFLTTVRDGSRGVLGKGWSLVTIEAVGPGGARAPLHLHLYSSAAPEYTSSNNETNVAIDDARGVVPKECIWAFDRGYDDAKFFDYLNGKGLRWVVRLQGQRKLYLPSGDVVATKEVAGRLPAQHVFTRPNAHWNNSALHVAWSRVRLNTYTKAGKSLGAGGKEFVVVVVDPRIPGVRPLVALTNIVPSSAAEAQAIVEAYFARWGVEEALRFEKQCFNLEDVRVLRWPALKRAVTMTMLAYGFLGVVAHEAPGETRRLVERVARAFGDVPRYWFYRLRDALCVLLSMRLWNRYVLRPP